ncbi:MAG: ABC transporter permease [Treponemataceae bacterium]|nr:ABC transporter permease [Treponemataceae bacterium]
MPWIFFISRRFAKVDSRGRAAASGVLASLGIGAGVAVLIVIVSVMNGFQAGYIKSIMEISSFHIRAVPETPPEDEKAFLKEILGTDGVLTAVPMYEAQSLVVGKNGRQQSALIRGLPWYIFASDKGFAEQITVSAGRFDIKEEMTCVLGSSIARKLSVRPGDEVNLLALSGGEETELFSGDRKLKVTGIFSCGYADINSSFIFISLDTAAEILGLDSAHFYGIKLKDSETDQRCLSILENKFPGVGFESWRSYNRSFFGALKIEKNVLMMLAFLIFVVVGVNIFNSMRRMVYEHHEETAVLSALGAKKKEIQLVFILQGMTTGLYGAIPGLFAGLAICAKMKDVFVLFSNAAYNVQLFFYMLFNPQAAYALKTNSMFLFYSKIPAVVVFSEVAYITLFGIAASLLASWFASRNALKVSVAEVLHDE